MSVNPNIKQFLNRVFSPFYAQSLRNLNEFYYGVTSCNDFLHALNNNLVAICLFCGIYGKAYWFIIIAVYMRWGPPWIHCANICMFTFVYVWYVAWTTGSHCAKNVSDLFVYVRTWTVRTVSSCRARTEVETWTRNCP